MYRCILICSYVFFFKQKTAYEMRISDWSSDVCSSDLAAAEWQPGVMRAAARGLPADQFALANDYAAFFDAVHDRALQWPKTPRSRLIASHGLARLSKSTPAAAENALPRFAQALGFTEEDRGQIGRAHV